MFDEMHWRNSIKSDKSISKKKSFVSVNFESFRFLQHLDFHIEKLEIDKDFHSLTFLEHLSLTKVGP